MVVVLVSVLIGRPSELVGHFVEQSDCAGNECRDIGAAHVGIGVAKAVLLEAVQLIVRVDRTGQRLERVDPDRLLL